MKVLLLTQVVPYPPASGPQVKTWNLVKWLGERHDVTLVSFARAETTQQLEPLRRHCRAVHTLPMVRGRLRDAWYLAASVWHGQPWIIERDARVAMHRLVAEVAGAAAFDIVHIDQLNMAQYAEHAGGAVTVLDAHNALWLLYRRLAATTAPGPRRLLLEREWRRLRAYEGSVGRSVDAVCAVSDDDRTALAAAIGSERPISVIPIAVDPNEIAPLGRRAGADRIVHLGTMFWPPNVDGVRWFIDAVWPRIRAARPEVGFDVIGARPPRALRAVAGTDRGIRVTGYVDDPTPYLERAALMVVPLRAASGMRVKILTAMAQGLPVVSTTIGCEGIAAEPGVHLLVADEPAAFADAVLRLLSDSGEAERLAANGRRLVERHYDYRQVCAQLQGVYDRATSRSAGGPPAVCAHSGKQAQPNT